MEYLPFGETLVDEHVNSNNSPFKFNGKEYDEETGNYYYSARYYDPKLSIFISVDPLVEKTMDAYGYCYNNPINLVDPDGRQSSPIYDTDGNFIATDSEGFAGEVIFMDRKIYNILMKNGNNKDENGKLKHDQAMWSGSTLAEVRAVGYTKSEINMVNNAITDIVSKTEGIPFEKDKLHNGTTSASFYLQNPGKNPEWAFANDGTPMFAMASIGDFKGKKRVMYNLVEFGGADFTVENLQNTWVHEWVDII